MTPPLLDAMAKLRELRWEARIAALARASDAHAKALHELDGLIARRQDVVDEAERRAMALTAEKARARGGAVALYALDLAAAKRRLAALEAPLAVARQAVVDRARQLEDARATVRVADSSKRRWSRLVEACRDEETAQTERRAELEDLPSGHLERILR